MSSSSSEKKGLLEGAEVPEAPYGSASVQKHPAEQPTAAGTHNSFVTYISSKRRSIPGYVMLQMIRTAGPYALYALFILLMAYLINQLDRYTLPIVTSSAGYDLKYGDVYCLKGRQYPKGTFEKYGITKNITDICSNDAYFDEDLNITYDVKGDPFLCENLPILQFYYNGTGNLSNDTGNLSSVCEYTSSGSGLTYQILAGPVFNNLYPLAGIFTGFLADYGRRTLWLSISLFLWSVVTGLTGFAKTFWQLVILRALLAIAAAGCNPFAVSLIGDYFPMEIRGSAISIYYFGIYIGYSLAFAIGNGITEVLNWRWVFFLSALAGFAVVPFVLFMVEPKRTKNVLVDKADERQKMSIQTRLLILLKTFLMPGMLTLCIAGGVRNAGGYVWAYNTELFFEKSGYSPQHIEHFMSWIPLVAGSIGAVVGGVISDLLVAGRGPYMRIWVLIFSQVLAAPFAAGALFLPNPWCFLSLIPSNVIGEMWIGVTTAIVVDLAPSKVRTGAVAIYLFIITVIGGNFNLIVEPIRKGFNQHFSYLDSYRLALLFTFPGVYAISSALFVLAFLLLRLDLKHKQRVEQSMLVNEEGGGAAATTTTTAKDSQGNSEDEVGPWETEEETN